MSLLTPDIRRALRLTRDIAVPSKDGSWDIGGTPLHQAPPISALRPNGRAMAQFYPRWVDKAAPGSA